MVQWTAISLSVTIVVVSDMTVSIVGSCMVVLLEGGVQEVEVLVVLPMLICLRLHLALHVTLVRFPKRSYRLSGA